MNNPVLKLLFRMNFPESVALQLSKDATLKHIRTFLPTELQFPDDEEL